MISLINDFLGITSTSFISEVTAGAIAVILVACAINFILAIFSSLFKGG